MVVEVLVWEVCRSNFLHFLLSTFSPTFFSFFSINLPRYSAKKILREKLIYAMNNCLALDADFRLAGGENTGWVLPTG